MVNNTALRKSHLLPEANFSNFNNNVTRNELVNATNIDVCTLKGHTKAKLVFLSLMTY